MKYDKKYRGRSIGRSFDTQNDKVVIASDEGNERTEYICPHCSSVLVWLNGNEEEMGCSICGVSFIPEIQQIRKRSKLSTPRPKNTETLVADPHAIRGGNSLAADAKIKHEPELSGSFKLLRDKELRPGECTVTQTLPP